jgi:glycosyltransferase involved in cell wall biosynthesis
MTPLEQITEPSVSVIIPAYNAERFLTGAVESVLSQTVLPKEIIVIDDGSADGTLKLARSFGGIVRCVSKRNGGPASARNCGICEATADWIAFLDADDQWHTHKLETQLQHIRQSGADLVSSDAALARGSDSGTTWMRHVDLWPRLRPFLGDAVLPNPFEMLLTIGCFLLPSMVLVRRTSLLDAGMFDEHLHGTEDIDLWLRLALICKFAIHPEPLITRQIHEHNITADARRMIVETIKVWDKLQNFEEVHRNPSWMKLVSAREAADYRDLGHWLLHDDRRIEARHAWWKSLHYSFSWPVAALWSATLFPGSVVRSLRALRRKLTAAARDSETTGWETQSAMKGKSG